MNNNSTQKHQIVENIKVVRSTDYQTICTCSIDDNKLSLRAKGMHAYLMTRPDDFVIQKTSLDSHFVEGRDAVNSTFAELVSAGYINKTRLKADNGRFIGWEYSVLEKPIIESVVPVKVVEAEKQVEEVVAEGVFDMPVETNIKSSYSEFMSNLVDFQKRWNIVAEKRNLPPMRSTNTTNRKQGWKDVFDIYPYSDVEFWNEFFHNLDSEEATLEADKVFKGMKYFNSDYFIRGGNYKRVEDLVNGTILQKDKLSDEVKTGATYVNPKSYVARNMLLKAKQKADEV